MKYKKVCTFFLGFILVFNVVQYNNGRNLKYEFLVCDIFGANNTDKFVQILRFNDPHLIRHFVET